MSNRQGDARKNSRSKRPGIEIDAVGAAIDPVVSGDRVAVHHGVGQAVATAQKGLADPDQILIPLLLQGNTGTHTRMHKQIVAAPGNASLTESSVSRNAGPWCRFHAKDDKPAQSQAGPGGPPAGPVAAPSHLQY